MMWTVIKKIFNRWSSPQAPKTHDERQQIGIEGEDLAARYVKHLGFKILGRRIRTPYGELDIVASDEDMLVFLEVKTRRLSLDDLEPARIISRGQERRIQQSAYYYLRHHHRHPVHYRFDLLVISILDENHPKLRWFPNIWDHHV